MTPVSAAGAGLPGRLRLLVATEMVGGLAVSCFLFAVFRVFGWPRPNDDVLADSALMLAPALIAIVGGASAHLCWRRGRFGLAWTLIVAAGLPLLIAVLLWLANWA